MYCHIAELMPFSANQSVRKKLGRIAEIRIDYVSLGHFGVCERLFRDADSQDPALSVAKEIYPALSSTTDAVVSFHDKYESGAAPTILDDLKQDLSALGESLAKRIDLEDRLCELMLQ